MELSLWTDPASPELPSETTAEQEIVNGTFIPRQAKGGAPLPSGLKVEQGHHPKQNKEAFFCMGPFPGSNSMWQEQPQWQPKQGAGLKPPPIYCAPDNCNPVLSEVLATMSWPLCPCADQGPKPLSSYRPSPKVPWALWSPVIHCRGAWLSSH